MPDIPYGKFRDKGTPIDNLSNYNSSEEQIVFVCDEGSLSMAKLLFATKQGMLKQVDGSEFQVAKRTIAATKLLEEDEVICVEVARQWTKHCASDDEWIFSEVCVDRGAGKEKRCCRSSWNQTTEKR